MPSFRLYLHYCFLSLILFSPGVTLKDAIAAPIKGKFLTSASQILHVATQKSAHYFLSHYPFYYKHALKLYTHCYSHPPLLYLCFLWLCLPSNSTQTVKRECGKILQNIEAVTLLVVFSSLVLFYLRSTFHETFSFPFLSTLNWALVDIESFLFQKNQLILLPSKLNMRDW